MSVRTLGKADEERIPTNLSLPRGLVSELDEVAGKRNRSAFVEDAIRYRLRREKLRRAWERAAGAWKAEDYPEFATADDVLEWVRTRRAETTDHGPEA